MTVEELVQAVEALRKDEYVSKLDSYWNDAGVVVDVQLCQPIWPRELFRRYFSNFSPVSIDSLHIQAEVRW